MVPCYQMDTELRELNLWMKLAATWNHERANKATDITALAPQCLACRGQHCSRKVPPKDCASPSDLRILWRTGGETKRLSALGEIVTKVWVNADDRGKYSWKEKKQYLCLCSYVQHLIGTCHYNSMNSLVVYTHCVYNPFICKSLTTKATILCLSSTWICSGIGLLLHYSRESKVLVLGLQASGEARIHISTQLHHLIANTP